MFISIVTCTKFGLLFIPFVQKTAKQTGLNEVHAQQMFAN